MLEVAQGKIMGLSVQFLQARDLMNHVKQSGIQQFRLELRYKGISVELILIQGVVELTCWRLQLRNHIEWTQMVTS